MKAIKTSFQVLSDYLDEAVPKAGVSGIDCIVYQDHQEIFRHAAGYGSMEDQHPLQPDALYNIYSATKVVTCVAAMQLLEKGKLALFEPVSRYLPVYADVSVQKGTLSVQRAKNPMQIQHLFTMTSGLSYNLETPVMRDFLSRTGRDFSTREFAEALAEQPLLFEPGEDWNYSFSHDVLGAVIEAASDMRLGEYLKKNIFDPLGMKDTAFELTDANRHRIAPQYDYHPKDKTLTRLSSDCYGKLGTRCESGGSGLVSGCEDYILFADALACGGVGKSGARILSQNSLRLMRANHLNSACLRSYHKMFPARGNGYGLGVSVLSDPAASLSLAPAGSFSWGGIGGVQNYFDLENRLSLFVAQHTRNSPKALIEPYLRNILYSIAGAP